ncbi:MAG: PKD domain-containing protein, partial [Gemmatimonadaceae bacterium]
LTGLGAGSSNLLVRVNGSVSPPPTQPPPTQPPPTQPPPATNTPPTANFSVSCSKAACSFDGSTSKDNLSIVSYSWTFGDGGSMISAASPYASHDYSGRGNYSMVVTLTVADGSGLKSTTQKSVSIKNNGH